MYRRDCSCPARAGDEILLNQVLTPLGSGLLVYTLPSGRVLVEFPWGDGELFYEEEVIPTCRKIVRELADVA